ncbi:proline-rich receptor-like protein kinase PERK12 [Henckelia pumila]|uniref:proline-rich receptor-like protein kinase PERK12 n=1 Tax=Henckelia pumila TaxID=405737 RepID=UPI003C6E238C
MASYTERSSSGSGSGSIISTTTFMPGRIVIAFDATKNRNFQELKDIIAHIRMRGDMIQEADRITVFGVLHKVLHPMGFQIQIGSNSFVGTHARAIKEDASRKVDAYVGMLQRSVVEFESEGVEMEVKIAVGAPIEKIVVQEIVSSNATWAILDRQLRTELRFYLKHIPCKVALVLDNMSLQVVRPYESDNYKEIIEQKLLYSLSKAVLLQPAQAYDSDKYSVISLSMDSPGSSNAPENGSESSSMLHFKDKKSLLQGSSYEHQIGFDSPQVIVEQRSPENHSEAPVFGTASKSKMRQNSMGCNYSEIQEATDYFSKENLLGEGGYGVVYKGQLQNGQLIVAKVKTEANTESFAEFQSEIDVLVSARHKNIVMLLGHCYEENSILVYEYVSNKSLHWHLFDNTEHVLEWKQRQSIAIGTAKGLRFLHEECRGCPIVHRDVRPSNILLTQEFVPLLGDCIIAKWKTKIYDKRTRHFHGLIYLAPEYRENGICSISTDVYAFGMVLIQMISGRRDVFPTRDNQQKSLRQWALPLIQKLALAELVDPRLGSSYSTHELCQMAAVAYLCVQTKPAMRPTMGEVLHLLEGERDRLRHFTEQMTPHLDNTQRPT